MEQITSPEPKLNPEVLNKIVINFMKRDIFERYKQTREVTDEDWEFCELIDWHPVDELPMKEEYIKKLREIEKGSHTGPLRTPEEFNEWCNSYEN